MGFVQRTTGTALDFNIVTISMFVKTPAAAITAAQEKFEGNSGFQFWMGVVPFLTWGTQGSGTQSIIGTVLLGNEPGIGDIFGTEISSTYDCPQGPSYIGLRCQPDEDPVLEVLIQTSSAANCTATQVLATGYELTGPPENTYEITYSDASEVDEDYNDFFGSRSQTVVTPDVRHHILISWDLSGGSATEGSGLDGESAEFEDSVTASSQMWMAFDDVNKTGFDLPMQWPGGGFDENRHTSYVAAHFAGAANTPIGTPAVTLSVGTIPTEPVSCPGPATINRDIGGSPGDTTSDAPVLNIQISELKIFTGVSLDTSVEANRRAFITSSGRAAHPSLAVDLMGKEPEVYFRTVADWEAGNNTGTAGAFVPTGTITEASGFF